MFKSPNALTFTRICWVASWPVEEWNQVSVAHPPGLIVVMSVFLDKPITLFAHVVWDDTMQEGDGIF